MRLGFRVLGAFKEGLSITSDGGQQLNSAFEHPVVGLGEASEDVVEVVVGDDLLLLEIAIEEGRLASHLNLITSDGWFIQISDSNSNGQLVRWHSAPCDPRTSMLFYLSTPAPYSMQAHLLLYMEKFRISCLTTIYLRIMQMGDGLLAQSACYSSIIAVIYEMVVAILILSVYQSTQFGGQVNLMERFPTARLLAVIIIALSLVLKLALLVGVACFSVIANTLLKKVILFMVSVGDQVLIILDSFMLGCMLDQEFSLIILAGANILCGFLLKLVNQLVSFNYAFIYPYPFKKMPTFFNTFLSAILQTLFLVFQLKMNSRGDIYMILFFVTAGLRLVSELRFFYDIPYLNGTILSLKLVIFNNWVCFTLTEAGAILFAIVAENTVVFYVVLSIFGLILNLTCASYIKEKRLVIDIETAQNWEDVNTKIQYSYEFISNDKLDKMSTISQQHFQKCKVPECRCRWSQMKSPIDFRRKIFSNKPQIFQLKVFLKYYLLVLCQNFKTRFSEMSQPWIVYISALSLLNLYPKLLYYTSSFESIFSNEVGFSQKSIVNFLKREAIQFIEEKNNKDSVLEIQRIKRVEELANDLKSNIRRIAEIKQKIWLGLLESPVEQEIIEMLFKSQIDQRDLILDIYNSITKIPHKKLALWRTMTLYCRNIIEDHHLQRTVRKNVSKQDLVTKNVEGIEQKQGTYPRKIEEFLDLEENYCLLKISMSEKTLGCIQWHNENIYDMLGFPKAKRLIGESIDILIPDIFKQYHAHAMKQWYEYPQTHKLNRLSETYIRTNIREFQSVFLYTKILTTEDDYGVFAILSQNHHQRFIVLDENLEDVIASNFIRDRLKGILNHGHIMLPLISKDYIKLKQVKGKKFQEHTLRFPIIKNYEQHYQRYQIQMGELDPELPKEQLQRQRQHIIQKIASQIAGIEELEWYQEDILAKHINITHKNVTTSYIVVKQPIDEESYNDQNQKLKRKKEFNHSTTFHVESSVDFQPGNTRTKEKQELEFQDSESSVSTSNNLTNRDFIHKITNVELLWLQKFFYVCLFVYFACELIRFVVLLYFTQFFQQLLTADISVGSFVKHASTIYDNALLNTYAFSNNGTGVPFTVTQPITDLMNFNYDKIIDQLQVQSTQVANSWLRQFSSMTVLWFASNGQTYNFPIMIWFQTWGKLSTMVSSNSSSAMRYITILSNNYNYLSKASHKFLDYYLQKAGFLTSMLKYTNVFILPLNCLIIAAILYFYNRYLKQKQKIRYDFIRIFTEIDHASIKSYAEKYQQYQEDISHMQSSLDEQEEKQTGPLNKKMVINKSKIPSLYRIYMLFIGAMIVFDIVASTYSAIRSNTLYDAYKSSSDLSGSFLYQLEALVEIKQMGMGIRTYANQSSIQQVSRADFQQFKSNAIKIFNQFTDGVSDKTNSTMFKLLINSICDALADDLPTNLQNICTNNFTLQIIRSGAMTFSHYVVDVIRQEAQGILGSIGADAKQVLPDIMTNASLVDGSLSLTYRVMIVQKIQRQIEKIVKAYLDNLRDEVIGMVMCTVGTLLAFVVLAYLFKKKENKEWRYIYGSLLIVPHKELLKASTVSKMIAQLKDKSLR